MSARRTAPYRDALVSLLVAAAVVGASGCTGGSPPTSETAPRLSPSAATAIVRAYAAVWGLASSTWNRAALGRIQTGAALEVSLAEFQAAEGIQLPPRDAPTLAEVKVVVPRSEQPAFPAHFLALVTWTSRETHPDRELLEFEQATPDAAWLVRSRAWLVNNAPLPAVAADPDGSATMVEARNARDLRFGAKALATLLASYYDQGQPPTGGEAARVAAAVARGPFASGLTALRAASNRNNQIQQLYRYQPGGYRKAAYPLADGGGLLLLTFSGSREVFPRDRKLVPYLQQGGSRIGLGGLVAPGVYQTVAFQTVTMLAVEVPPAGSTGKVRVVAWREQDVSATVSAATV